MAKLRTSKPTYRIFDLDGTLYPRENPLFLEIRKCTNAWLARALGVPEQEAIQKNRELKPQYPNYLDRFMKLGLTVRDYHREVFQNLRPEKFLCIDEELVQILAQLVGPNYLVTCAPREYAELVLKALGIRNFMNEVYSIEDGHHLKQERYQRLLKTQVVVASETAVFGDNFVVDLQPAINVGIEAVMIGHEDPEVKLERFQNIREALRAKYDIAST